MAKAWQKLVESAPVRSYRRTAEKKERLLCRYVPREVFEGAASPEFLFASGNRNRCNPKGVACVYFGEGPETARAEFDSYYREPLTEIGFYGRVSLRAILDFENEDTRKHFGLGDRDFTRSYVTKLGDLIPLQEIGKAVASQKRISAIRFPSHAMRKTGRKGVNLVVFRDAVQDPDFVEILERDTVIERWPRS